MDEGRENTIAFGPVGLAGIALLLLGILRRSRFVALLGLGAVVADVTVRRARRLQGDERAPAGVRPV